MSLHFSLSEKFSQSAAPRLSKVSVRAVKRRSSTRAVRFSFALLLILLAASSTLAMPLDEYRKRIQQSVTMLDELWEEEESETVEHYAARAHTIFEKVRRLVPADETIEWEGGRVRVNNSWLNEEINNYERLPLSDTRRGDALMRITQRLLALVSRMNELDGLKESAASPTKEQEKARLKTILSREEYVEKPPQKSLWERFVDWLNSLFPGRSIVPGQLNWMSTIAMIIIFGLAAALLAYVLWKFVPAFSRKATQLKIKKSGARVVLGERLAADETAADLLAAAEALARKGELRAAIRKGYIALLCELGERKVLTLAQHKTNHDYLRAVREKRPLLNEMQKLTNSFENHWYGFVPATANDWTAFRTGYQQTLKTASLLSDE
jgi:uncharacterized protein DUF4129